MKFFIFIISILFFIPNTTWALEKKFQLKNTTVELEVPNGWYDVQGFFGSDLSLLGKETKPGQSRTTISIYDAEASLSSFPVSAALENKKEFFDEREKWINSQDGGKYLKQLSARELKFSDSKNSGLEMGFEYTLENKKYREYSYYVTCNSEFLFIKGLVPEDKFNTEEERILTNLPQSIKCAGPGTGVVKTSLNPEQLKNILDRIDNPKTTAAVIESLRNFILKYDENIENKDENSDLFSINEDPRANKLIANFFKIPLLIIEATKKAQAESVYQAGGKCIFAGWVSVFVKKSNGQLTCQNPKIGSPSYGSGSCGANSFTCNPSLFGPGVCISEVDKQLNQSATFRCNEKRKPDSEILEYAKQHPEELKDIVQGTNQLCANSEYLKNNPELCKTLVDDLGNFTDENGESAVANAEKAFEQFLKNKEIPEQDFEAAVKQVNAQLKMFEQACMTSENTFNTGTVQISDINGNSIGSMNCEEERKSVLSNLEKLKRAEIKHEVNHPKASEEKCEPKNNDLKNQGVKINDALVNMSCDGKKPDINLNSIGHCAQDINCAIAQAIPIIGDSQIKLLEKVAGKKLSSSFFGKNCTGKDSCLAQAATAVIKGLWSSLKGLVDLGKLAKDFAVKKATDAWNWVTGSQVENAASKRIHEMSKQMNSTFEEFKKDPFAFIGNVFKGIMNGITKFMTDDVFCMKWSGAPRFSKCEKPLPSLGCMDCKTLINGSCAAVGYIAEKIGESLTGSMAFGAVGGIAKNMAGSIAGLLKKSAKTGKLAQVEAAMMKTMPRLTGAMNKVVTASIKMGKQGLKAASEVSSKIGSNLKYIHAETIAKAAEKISSLKVVSAVAKSSLVVKTGSAARQFISLHERAYAFGLKTTLKANSPKIPITSLAKVERAASNVEVKIKNPGPTSIKNKLENGRPEYVIENGKVVGSRPQTKSYQDVSYEEVKPSVNKIGNGSPQISIRPAQTAQRAESAMAQTAQRAESAMAQTVQRAESATAQTVQRAESATAQTVQRAESATAQTVQRAESATAQTAQRAESATAQTAQRAESATAQTAQRAESATAQTAQRAESATAQNQLENQAAQVRLAEPSQRAPTFQSAEIAAPKPVAVKPAVVDSDLAAVKPKTKVPLNQTAVEAKPIVVKEPDVYVAPKMTRADYKELEEKTFGAANRNLFDIERGTVAEARAANSEVVKKLNEWPTETANPRRKSGFNNKEIDELYAKVEKNEVSGLCKLTKYDPENKGTGFCFGRATAAHIEALMDGISKDQVRKVWAVGRFQTGEANWRYHVSTIVRNSEGKWMAIDPIMGKPLPVEEWYRKMQGFDVEKNMRLFTSRAERYGPSGTAKYSRDSFEYYNEYFSDLMADFRKKNKAIKRVMASPEVNP
jgi:hypothetical protein